MREEGIKVVWVRPCIRTTINPDFDEKLKNILSRDFNPSAPNSVWATDITYCYTLAGFVYLTSVMDLYSRKIISCHLSDSLSSEGVIAAINEAEKARNPDTFYNTTTLHSFCNMMSPHDFEVEFAI